MVLPALQVRVPNPANALLQAEQIKGARAQTQALQRQEEGRNALLTAFQGNDFRTPAGRNAIVGQVAQTAPLQALQLQQQFGQLSAQDQARVAQQGQTVARALVGVRSPEAYAAARAALGPLGQDLPEQFDPATVQSTIQMAQSISDLTVNASTQAQIAASDRRATLPTPALSDARQAQELAQIAARRTTPAPSQFDQRVSELRTRGFSQADAEDIAAGRRRVTTNPVTGENEIVNVATGETTRPSTPAGPTLTDTERGRLFNQNESINRVLGLAEGLEDDAAAATGPGGSVRTLVNTLAGFLGTEAPIPAPQTAEARAQIRLFNQIAKAALVNNPRFPVAEQQIVERLLPDPDAFFANPSVEFNKVVQLQQFLNDFRTENERSLGVDPSPRPAATREGVTATNPTTGERLILRNGQWEPM